MFYDAELIKKLEAFQNILDQDPPKDWIKQHPLIKDKTGKPIEYLPIDKVDWLLKKLIMRYKWEVVSTEDILNGVKATVRLHYFHPVLSEWMFHDGVGADPYKLDQGAAKNDLSKVKSGAIQMAVPNSVTYAKKNAAKNLGRVFGQDLSRDDEDFQIVSLYADVPKLKPEPAPAAQTAAQFNGLF